MGQRKTSQGWKYIYAHALCMLHDKVYKQALRIFNTSCFLATTTTVRRSNLNVNFTIILPIPFVDLNEIWTNTPPPVERVISWSNSLHTTTCSGKADVKFWMSVCSLWHAAYKAHAPKYIFMCGWSSSVLSFKLLQIK